MQLINRDEEKIVQQWKGFQLSMNFIKLEEKMHRR